MEINVPGIRSLFSNHKLTAKRRGWSFSLSLEQFASLIFKKCTYCDGDLSNCSTFNGKKLKYNGLDRKDSSLGYTIDNVVSCCKRCNRVKNNLTSEEFIELAHKILQVNCCKNPIDPKKLKYYYERALATSRLSPDPATKVGALLIHPESGAVIAEGYNGFIRGAPDKELPTTRPEKYDYIVHAETNLVCNAVRHGISTDKCVVFCTLSPCVKCMRFLYQAGIKTIYFKDFYSDFQQCSSMLDLLIKIVPFGDFSKLELTTRGLNERTKR